MNGTGMSVTGPFINVEIAPSSPSVQVIPA